jgi:hypothetical protein
MRVMVMFVFVVLLLLLYAWLVPQFCTDRVFC